jgi:hypothetical protein
MSPDTVDILTITLTWYCCCICLFLYMFIAQFHMSAPTLVMNCYTRTSLVYVSTRSEPHPDDGQHDCKSELIRNMCISWFTDSTQLITGTATLLLKDPLNYIDRALFMLYTPRYTHVSLLSTLTQTTHAQKSSMRVPLGHGLLCILCKCSLYFLVCTSLIVRDVFNPRYRPLPFCALCVMSNQVIDAG